jgi:hypothetical protein
MSLEEVKASGGWKVSLQQAEKLSLDQIRGFWRPTAG